MKQHCDIEELLQMKEEHSWILISIPLYKRSYSPISLDFLNVCYRERLSDEGRYL